MNKLMFDNLFREEIEKILGYDISDCEMNSVNDFRCLDNKKISDLRRLSEKDEFFAKYYLEYMATKENEEHAFPFVINALKGRGVTKDWMKEVVIIVDFDKKEILNLKSIDSMLSILKKFSDQYGFSKIEFDLKRWRSGFKYIGAPCVRLTNYDYRTKLPPFLSLVRDNKIVTCKVNNIKITTLRWLVSYMARLIWEYLKNKEKNKINLAEEYSYIFTDDFKINPVMESVIRVLEKELELIGGYYTDEIAPGFTLNDEQIKKYL